MTDKLKPVRCGCGGEAEIGQKYLMGNLPDVYVLCGNCSIRTGEYYSEVEAIEAWNKAMGANHFRGVTKKVKPERTEPDRKFLEIIAEYPKICTYPEYKDKPYYSIKYEENGETIVGFGTYKPEVLSQYLREYFLPSAEPERTAKVVRVDKKNFKCLNCGQNFHAYMWAHPTNYCSFCGAKLDWSGNE